LLESADASRSLLARHQAGEQGEAISTTDLVLRISELVAGRVPGGAAPAPLAQAPAPVVAAAAPAPAFAPALTVSAGQPRQLQIQIGPLERPEQADAIKELFRDIPGLGSISDLPTSDPATRRFAVETTSTNDDLLDLFAFHVAKEQVSISDGLTAGVSLSAAAPQAGQGGDAAGLSYGFFHDAPGAPGAPGAPT